MPFFYLLLYALVFFTLQLRTQQYYISADNYSIALPEKVNGDKKLYIGHALRDEDLDVSRDIKYEYTLRNCQLTNERGRGQRVLCQFTDIHDDPYEVNLEVLNGPSCPLDNNTKLAKAEFHAYKYDFKTMESKLQAVEMPVYFTQKNTVNYVELYNSMYFDFWTDKNCHFRLQIYTKGFFHYFHFKK